MIQNSAVKLRYPKRSAFQFNHARCARHLYTLTLSSTFCHAWKHSWNGSFDIVRCRFTYDVTKHWNRSLIFTL